MTLLNRVTHGSEVETRIQNKGFYPVLGLGVAIGVGVAALIFSGGLFFRPKRKLGRKVKDLMIKNPISARSGIFLVDVSRMMADHSCGEIPVVDETNRPIGVITDRDIVCRTLAQGINPLTRTVETIMSTPVKTVGQNADLNDCMDLMEENQIRRVLVVDDRGSLCGIISQTDIARLLSQEEAARAMGGISQPTAA